MNPFKLLPPPDPSHCPRAGCSHDLPPGELSETMVDLFQDRRKLLSKPGHSARKLEHIDSEICEQIIWELRQGALRTLGRQHSWPHSLDYSTIVKQVLEREEEILEMTTDPSVLVESVVWEDFTRAIDGKIHEFGATETDNPDDYAVLKSRCG